MWLKYGAKYGKNFLKEPARGASPERRRKPPLEPLRSLQGRKLFFSFFFARDPPAHSAPL
ncbi:hypothetical protein A1D31_34490 [Bradyrhizobium liaoningense]|nr:hypothetical protein A1D31_34490 [Bradyrhizobium liaoningense]